MSQDYTTTFAVYQTPHEAFAAINDVRGWWTETMEGDAQKLNDEFEVRFGDVHYSKQQLVELIPDKKVVWLIKDSYLNFIADNHEWTGTRVVFEISQNGDKTEIRFTHEGLAPVIECYDACSNAWSGYVSGSLRALIVNGKGQPFKQQEQPEAPVEKVADTVNNPNFSTSFTVDQTPEQTFAAINNVRGWWSEEIEGHTDKLGEVFNYHFSDVHRCTMKITELVPDQKVVWLVLDNYFNFIQDKTEWKGTEIVFEISKKGDQTEVHFTHLGLVPDYECFDVCSNAWGSYIKGSLRSLITTGKGTPNADQRPTTEAEKKFLASENS